MKEHQLIADTLDDLLSRLDYTEDEPTREEILLQLCGACRVARSHLGMAPRFLAEVVGVPRDKIDLLEHGRGRIDRSVSPDRICAVARTYSHLLVHTSPHDRRNAASCGDIRRAKIVLGL